MYRVEKNIQKVVGLGISEPSPVGFLILQKEFYQFLSSWLVEPPHLKNMFVKMGENLSPILGVNMQKI